MEPTVDEQFRLAGKEYIPLEEFDKEDEQEQEPRQEKWSEEDENEYPWD